MLAFLWLHAIGAFVVAFVRTGELDHAVIDSVLIVFPTIAATRRARSRTTQACWATLGLVVSSAVLVHLTGGLVEAHFHFFVVLGIAALYQNWAPFLVALGFVVLHHGVLGTLNPAEVYDNPSAIAHPWRWAGIHAIFVLMSSAASVAAWRLNEHQAVHDPLTQLPNRLLFSDSVERALERIERGESTVGVLFIDLDDFKGVNDSLGHDAGDRVIVEVTKRLGAGMRPGDVVARFGGDEFALLLRDVGQGSDAQSIAERVIGRIAEPMSVSGHELTIGASVGIALGRPGHQDAMELLRDADTAMYAAKSRGKGQWVLFDPSMHTEAIERVRIDADLRSAIDANEFMLVYQPIVDLRTGGVVGMEALVRWRHPERGTLTPASFIFAAERTGLIREIGRWVLREAAIQAAEWSRSFPSEPARYMSINVSARQLEDDELVADVAAVIEETGLDPRLLVLELTETAIMGDPDRAAERLDALKALGVQIAIDDFGTGYSSLAYLQRFPIDILKIDRAFVQRLGLSAEESSLTHAILKIARGLGIATVAEGIERTEQADELIRFGAETGQGYLFAEPLFVDQIEKLLASRTRLRLPAPPKGTVLLVDDDSAGRAALVRWLERAGFKVRQAATGEEGLDMARRFDHRLVVLDVALPDIPGAEVLRLLKSDPRTSGTPVIHLSGSLTDVESRTRGLAGGADRYLLKPIRGDELVANIEAVLRSQRAVEHAHS